MMNSGTNDLLQNLDMEMQLLKKKREVIEQQMMCSQRMQLQNEYNPGPSNVSYGHQYQTVHRPPKRQNVTPWQNEPLTKIGRPASHGENSWYQPKQNSYPPKRFQQYKNKQQNNKFVPTKVEKNKPKQMNNQAPVRKTLINETRNMTKAKKPNNDIFANDILYPDKVPTEKMTGRLELALGMILKEMRKEYWNVNLVKRFFDFNITKNELKFTIRERLRDLLLCKPVPHFGTIHTMYRRKYPIESDAELINIISENHNLKDKFKKFYLVFKPTEQPQEFVENNFKNIISNKLRDMFKEIEAIYKNKSEEETMKCTVLDHVHILRDPNEPRPPRSTEESEEKRDELDQPVDMNKPYKDMSVQEKLYYIKKHIHETVNAHLPTLLASCAAEISNLLCDQECTKLLKGSLVTKINPKFKGMFLKKTNFNAADGKPEDGTIKGKYYAKVSCHPRLPSREEMQPFLLSFKPCAIKKPKNSDEIVLVLFNTKEEREALLAANGTVLHDKYPLNIVPAEAAAPTQQTTASNDNKDVTSGTDSENDKKVIKSEDNKDATRETVVKSESSNDNIDVAHDVTKANDERIDNENLTHDADTEMSPSNDKDSEINKTHIEQESSNNGDLEKSNEERNNVANTSTGSGDLISSDLDQQIDALLTSISRCNAEMMETVDNESKKDSQVDDESKFDQTPQVELDDDNSKSNEELKINEDLNADDGDSAMVIDDAKETDENNSKVDTDENNAKVDTDENKTKVYTNENNSKVDTDENNHKVDSGENKTKVDTDENKTKVDTDENKTKVDTDENKTKVDTDKNNLKVDSDDNNAKVDTDGNNAKVDTDGNKTQVDTVENNAKVDTDENNAKADTDGNNPKVDSDESKATTSEKVKEDAKSAKNESAAPVRASGRIATRRSSRFVTNN